MQTIEGDWIVFREKTRKPFERFRIDATRGLMQGLSALVTTHRWEGAVCHISSFGAISTLSYEHGEVVCRLKISSWGPGVVRAKILSDVGAVTRDVAGLVSFENHDIFIVHGHDDVPRKELRSLIESFGLRPIVLVDQDDRGMTIIEKFEYYASTCSFAFILMTPDDRMDEVGDAEQQFRARQNVIMELGWFMARLGRERVVLLHKGEVEIPSDISGVVYIGFQESVYEVADKVRQRLKGVGLMS
jgi:predicted nucleotide-binding protein